MTGNPGGKLGGSMSISGCSWFRCRYMHNPLSIFCLRQRKASANEIKCYIYHLFSHCLRHFLVRHRKRVQTACTKRSYRWFLWSCTEFLAIKGIFDMQVLVGYRYLHTKQWCPLENGGSFPNKTSHKMSRSYNKYDYFLFMTRTVLRHW